MIINKRIYDHLKTVARLETTIHYGKLAEVAGLDIHNQADRLKLGRYLNDICHYEYAHGRPMLPVVVIRERLHAPGKTFFAMVRQLGLVNGEADQDYFTKELQRVHAFWKRMPEEEADHKTSRH